MNKRSLEITILKFFIFAVIVIVGFTYAFINESVLGDNNDVAWSTYFYFSCVTYLTIGYGDLAPQNEIGQILIAYEGFAGIVINSIFAGQIFMCFLKQKKPFIFTKHLFVKRNKEKNKNYLSIRIGNMNDEIIDVKTTIEIFIFKGERREKIASLEKIKDYIEKVIYVEFSFSELPKDLKKHLNSILNNTIDGQIRVTCKGIDPYYGTIQYNSKVYKFSDIGFIEKYNMFYKWKRGKRKYTRWSRFNSVIDLSQEEIDRIKKTTYESIKFLK